MGAIVVRNIGPELFVVSQLWMQLSVKVSQTLFVKILELDLRVSHRGRPTVLPFASVHNRRLFRLALTDFIVLWQLLNDVILILLIWRFLIAFIIVANIVIIFEFFFVHHNILDPWVLELFLWRLSWPRGKRLGVWLFAVVVAVCDAFALQALLVCGFSHVKAVLGILIGFTQVLVCLVACEFWRIVVLESHGRILKLVPLVLVTLVWIDKVHQRAFVLCVWRVGFDRVINIRITPDLLRSGYHRWTLPMACWWLQVWDLPLESLAILELHLLVLEQVVCDFIVVLRQAPPPWDVSLVIELKPIIELYARQFMAEVFQYRVILAIGGKQLWLTVSAYLYTVHHFLIWTSEWRLQTYLPDNLSILIILFVHNETIKVLIWRRLEWNTFILGLVRKCP